VHDAHPVAVIGLKRQDWVPSKSLTRLCAASGTAPPDR
jgi:hypothetical protein